MHHELLTHRVLFCLDSNAKEGMPSQKFVTHVTPPLRADSSFRTHTPLMRYGGGGWEVGSEETQILGNFCWRREMPLLLLETVDY